MRALVCGSRRWNDRNIIWDLLDGVYGSATIGHLLTEMSEFVLIEGGAPGADRMAKEWAKNSPMHSYNERPDDPRFEHLPFPADWDKYGKAAGAIRNQQMLDEGKPDLVFAFTDDIEQSRGTRDMCNRAKKAGVPVYIVGRY